MDYQWNMTYPITTKNDVQKDALSDLHMTTFLSVIACDIIIVSMLLSYLGKLSTSSHLQPSLHPGTLSEQTDSKEHLPEVPEPDHNVLDAKSLLHKQQVPFQLPPDDVIPDVKDIEHNGTPGTFPQILSCGSTPENGEEPRPVCIDVPVPPIRSCETRQRPLLHRSYSLTIVAMGTESVTDVLPLSSSASAPSLVSLSCKSQEDCAEPSVDDVVPSDSSETQPDDNTSLASASNLDSETSGNEDPFEDDCYHLELLFPSSDDEHYPMTPEKKDLPRNNGGGHRTNSPSAIEITELIEHITGTGILPNSLIYLNLPETVFYTTFISVIIFNTFFKK